MFVYSCKLINVQKHVVSWNLFMSVSHCSGSLSARSDDDAGREQNRLSGKSQLFNQNRRSREMTFAVLPSRVPICHWFQSFKCHLPRGIPDVAWAIIAAAVVFHLFIAHSTFHHVYHCFNTGHWHCIVFDVFVIKSWTLARALHNPLRNCHC